jgi:hypothetical protein
MASAQVALATITLGSTASTVTFGSIPSTYRDLRIVFSGRMNAAEADLIGVFNSDTGANYSRVFMFGNGSSAVSSSGSSETNAKLSYVAYQTETVHTIDIMDYSATDKHKTTLNRGNSPSIATYAWCNRWASTSAITSIALSGSTGVFASGSIFSLYGIVSA